MSQSDDAKNAGKDAVSEERAAVGAAVDAENGLIGDDSGSTPALIPTPPEDPQLAAIVSAWPTLPDAIKAGILAMVQASGTLPQ